MPLGVASVCSEKMADADWKLFCVLECNTSKSVVTVQRGFCAQYAKLDNLWYAKDPPTDKAIRARYKQFTETGCLCKQKARMLKRVLQELEYLNDMCRVTRGAHNEHN